MIDINNAKEIFKEYVKNYDPTNPRIALKIAHTYRVSEMSRIIANSIFNKTTAMSKSNNEEKIEIAELIGLLHDIGRFEQLRRFDSFIDRQTVDHANLGIEILTDNNNELLNKFCPEEKYHKIILTSIKNHNKFKIESGLSEDVLTQCKIIRDADKIDILNLDRKEKFQTIYKKDSIENEEISENIYEDFINLKQTDRHLLKTDMDDWILMIGMIFDINYPMSFNILNKKNYINELFDRVENSNNKEKIEKLRMTAYKFLKEKEI